MILNVLIVLFSILASMESFAYALYEFKVNENRGSSIVLMLISVIGLVFPIGIFFAF